MARTMCCCVEVILTAIVVGLQQDHDLRGAMLVMMVMIPDMRDEIAKLDAQQSDDGQGYENAAHGAI